MVRTFLTFRWKNRFLIVNVDLKSTKISTVAAFSIVYCENCSSQPFVQRIRRCHRCLRLLLCLDDAVDRVAFGVFSILIGWEVRTAAKRVEIAHELVFPHFLQVEDRGKTLSWAYESFLTEGESGGSEACTGTGSWGNTFRTRSESLCLFTATLSFYSTRIKEIIR